MLLKKISPFFRRLDVKLTLWASVFFITASLMLYAVAYFHLASAMMADDLARTDAAVKRYIELYKADGMEQTTRKMPEEKEFFFRLADHKNQTIYIQVPGQYKGRVDLAALEHPQYFEEGKSFKFYKQNDDDFIEIVSAKLPDGFLLQAGLGNDLRDKRMDEFWEAFAFILFPMVFLGLIGGLFITNRLLTPLRGLVYTVQKISAGKMDARVPVSGSGDELDALSDFFNQMLEKIQKLIRGMEEALDNVAHDLRTPLTRMRFAVENVFGTDSNDTQIKEVLLDCAEESEKIMSMLDTLMDITEARSGAIELHFEDTAIKKLINEIADLYRYVAETRDIRIKTQVEEDLSASLDRNRIRQAVANLVDNAVKYARQNGTIEISAACKEEKILINVKDDGIGIDDYDLPKIFDRLYRADKSRSRKGMGLGLSLVQAVVYAHRGDVRVKSRPGAGSVFTIILPKGPLKM